jgi:hypothetical protein
MSDYNKSTNFAAKDNLSDADPGKIIKGSELDQEFNQIVTAVNSKANISSPALSGAPTAPTASIGTNSTQLATTEFVQSAVDVARTYTNLQSFKDTAFNLVDNTDTTKKVALELNGLTTATTRTLTVADKSGTIALTSDLTSIDPLNANTNSYVSGSYSVTSSATITITATNTFSANQRVYITFTNTSGTSLTSGEFTIVSATGSNFVITYGSSVTSTGTIIAARYGYSAIATPTEVTTGTDNLKFITPSNLKSRLLTQGTEKAWNWNSLTTNTSLDVTGIPSWVKRITILVNGISTTGTNDFLLQLGTTSSYEITGYVGTSAKYANGNTTSIGTMNSAGFNSESIAASLNYGSFILTNISGNTWVVSATISRGNTVMYVITGSKSLSGTLDRIRYTTVGATDTFDAGTMNILYE